MEAVGSEKKMKVDEEKEGTKDERSERSEKDYDASERAKE